MLNRLFAWLVGAPALVILIVLSVANRHEVLFSLDPRGAADSQLGFQVPLYLLLFTAVFAGLIIGWLVGWAGQGRWRREAKARRRAAAEEDRKRRGQAAAHPVPSGPVGAGGARAGTELV
jgi:uncharacterized integral membrane protein